MVVTLLMIQDDGFRSLPPLGAGDGGLQQDTDLRGSQKGQAGGALESGTTEEGWRERQEAVRAATQVCFYTLAVVQVVKKPSHASARPFHRSAQFGWTARLSCGPRNSVGSF